VWELVDGVTALARTDAVRRRAVEHHALAMWARILRKEQLCEEQAVLKLLWELSFLEDTRLVLSVGCLFHPTHSQ